MKRFFLFGIVFWGLALATVSCRGQLKPALTKDGVGKQDVVARGSAKVVKNGLIEGYPQSYWFVQCGLEDKNGNLWFGSSADGVYCYDGKVFTNYTRKDGLCHNDVICMLEDNTGGIWFGTRGGLCRYDVLAGKAGAKGFTPVPILVNGGGFGANFVWCLMQDKKGRIWCGTNEGVFYCDSATGVKGGVPVFKLFLSGDSVVNKNKLKLKMVQRMVEDKEGAIWFASGDFEGEGVCCYKGDSLVNFTPGGVRSFRSVLVCKNGDLLFLSQNKGVYRYNGKVFSDFTENTVLKLERVTCALEDKKGNVWFGADSDGTGLGKGGNGGAWCYDGALFKLFTKKDGLSDNGVFCILEGRDGTIWFGTRNTGLCCYNGKGFTDFTE